MSKFKRTLVYVLTVLIALPVSLIIGSAKPASAANYLTTESASDVTLTEATLNGTNGDSAATGHSFWVSESTFDTADLTPRAGLYWSDGSGAVDANAKFSASLSSVKQSTDMASISITSGTKYYYTAWVCVGGAWYPGEIKTFSTIADIRVTAENFNTHKSADYSGATVGYRLDGIDAGKVALASISLYDAADNKLVENTSKSAAKVNNSLQGPQYSSAFIVESGTYSSSSTWNFGSWTPKSSVEPTRAVITLTDVNGLSYSVTNSAFQSTLPSHPTWKSLFTGTLSAINFGVVDHDSISYGVVKGYESEFGLDDATFDTATSIVIRLYATGDQLLQTNTATMKVATLTGAQIISSPFDVTGTFNYLADGYWTNVRAIGEYGQSIPAVKVVATVTLANGKVVIAEKMNPSGDMIKPTKPVATPSVGDYATSQNVALTSSDNVTSPENIKIYYTLDGTIPTIPEESNTSVLYASAIVVDHDMTIKAIAYDETGNASEVAEFAYDIAPTITAESSVKSFDEDSATIVWTTQYDATSRVVYDTVPHAILGAGANYGYAFSTVATTGKSANHSVAITGLKAGVTYYFRAISSGSPETVGAEVSFKTKDAVIAEVATPAIPVAGPSVAPAKAQASDSAVTTTPSTTVDKTDEQGQIKGDETAADETDKINWTPWIILFILILLAGAATGGYFYWFGGDDGKTETVVKKPEAVKPVAKVETEKPVAKTATSKKKSRRW